MNIHELLTVDPIVPLVQADDPEVAVNISRALAAGGLRVVEVVLRTERALSIACRLSPGSCPTSLRAPVPC